MDYLLEVARIVDGAVKGDRAKVIAYVDQLARKLREAGDASAAERVLKAAQSNKTSEVSATAMAAAPRLPVDSESRLALADEDRLSRGDVTVILDQAAQQRVREFVTYIKAADRLLASRVGIAPSMLIYGPPGVGKTELARYIAAELELPLVTGRSDSLISSFLGSTAKNLRMLFEHAISRPCVLFLDELDSVAKLRDDQHELGELKRVVVSLLQNIDALDSQVILLAATNHHHLLDPAVWRRFAYKIELTLPDIDARTRLYELFLDAYSPSTKSLRDFALLSEQTTGADIRQICESAMRAAVLAGRDVVEPLEVIREVIVCRLGRKADFTRADTAIVQGVRELNPNVLTLKRLARLFGSSEATISRRLRPGEDRNARRTKTPNKGRDSAGTRPQASSRRRRPS
ncbi:MAG: ATP-binding protein [Phycisphaerae bacterium]